MEYFHAPDGTRLAYRDEGAGVPVLCLPGLTRTGGDFNYVAPHLSHIRLIRLDFRGRGASDWADPATYTPAHEAGDVIALLDHLGLEKTAILGTSRGGLVAMILATTAKDRLLGVCFNDIGPAVSPEGLRAIAAYIGVPPSQTTHEAAAKARAGFMTDFRNVPESRWLEEVRLHFPKVEGGLGLTYDPALGDVVKAGDLDTPPEIWPFFDALDGLPLGLIRGESSNILSRATADEMRRRRPDMVFREVKDRGHVPFLDEPEALDVAQRWLEALT